MIWGQTSARFGDLPEAVYLDLDSDSGEIWPGLLAFHRNENAKGVVICPLVFGGRSIGFLALTFPRKVMGVVQRPAGGSGAPGHARRATDTAGLSASETAVLRSARASGRRSADGLAQAFTGILLQLGAVEEFPSCKKRGSELCTHPVTHPRPRPRRALEARRSVMALRLDRPAERAWRWRCASWPTAPPFPVVSPARSMAAGPDGPAPRARAELPRMARREAVSNAMRHARPHLVRIAMTDEATS